MTYYITAWVKDGAISLLETDTHPITENHAPEEEFDVMIGAEMPGAQVDGAMLLARLTVSGDKLGGVKIVKQWVLGDGND